MPKSHLPVYDKRIAIVLPPFVIYVIMKECTLQIYTPHFYVI